MQLGRDDSPDVLAVGLSGTDVVGHAYGNGGQEMCLQLLSLDRDLGDFFLTLDRSGLDYAVVLTADHGGLDLVARLRDRGVASAARADSALVAETMSKTVADRLGLKGTVLRGDTSGSTVVSMLPIVAGCSPRLWRHIERILRWPPCSLRRSSVGQPRPPAGRINGRCCSGSGRPSIYRAPATLPWF